ncbi:thymidine kinase [Armatimonadetes bacterium Uphvl-Ar1]|nr:thymidine kinase [Armatimonadetes bacterium Uphvl-Ar1]
MKKCGQLIVVCGSMYAGKSEELIRRARRALFAKKQVQVFKPAIDIRYDEEHVVTHMGVKHPSKPVRNVEELRQSIAPNTEVICIEEVQFFDPSIVPFLTQLADKGVEVIAAGLDQDFRRQPFGPMPELLAVADEVVKLRAICMKCGRPASHTQRIIDGKPAKWNDPIVLIGATESYEARCRACHQINQPKKLRG